MMSGGHYLAGHAVAPAYERVDGILRGGGCVVLDGGVATELQRIRRENRARRREPWGTWALFQGPMEVLEVHRRYVRAGADVLSTNTWSVLEAADASSPEPVSLGRDPFWLDAARLGVRLARHAVSEAGRGDSCAVAFCINSALLDERASGRLELLSWAWSDEPPDLVILETLETVPDDVAIDTIAMVCSTGLPTWVAFRRRDGGMSTVDGVVTPDPDPEAFAHALGRLERAGVAAVLANCVPTDDLGDTVARMCAQTSMPVGCYPNLGHGGGDSWEFDDDATPDRYAELARSWVAAGARIVGGCCGVTPEHVAAIRSAVGAHSPGPGS